MIIFELAIEKILDAIASGEIELSEDAPWFLEDEDGLETITEGNSSTRGGFTLEALYYITGISGTRVSTKDEMEDELDKFMENGGQDYVLTAGGVKSGGCVVKDVNGEEVKLVSSHAYAIKSADEDTVTVVNPWDSSKEIVLSRETFLEAFGRIDSLSDSEIEEAYNILCEDETATTESVYTEITERRNSKRIQQNDDSDDEIITKLRERLEEHQNKEPSSG